MQILGAHGLLKKAQFHALGVTLLAFHFKRGRIEGFVQPVGQRDAVVIGQADVVAQIARGQTNAAFQALTVERRLGTLQLNF